jgi:hypothetical protein
MAKNSMQDLRNHLFETLEALKDDEKPTWTSNARKPYATLRPN